MKQDQRPNTNTAEGPSELGELNARSRDIFREIVESFLATGTPVGSRNVSRQLPMTLSPASVRNIMSDLEALGLIYAPHTSAGRLPTELGLRFFVDGLLELGDLSDDERRQIEGQMHGTEADLAIEDMLSQVGEMLSGLSSCAGVVLTDKQISRLKHIEFVSLEPTRALVVLVGEDGSVENRILDVPQGLPPAALVEASNYLNTRIRGKTIIEASAWIDDEVKRCKAELDELTASLIEEGLATWSGGQEGSKSLIVRGRSNLLEDVNANEDLERIRTLFDDLETKKDLIQLLGLAEEAEGVRIFIGSENQLFSLSGSSLIVAPFRDLDRQIVGVLGVIGPTRLNYARIIPMVDYTAKLVGRLLT
ncbi:MAG: heat-inducible transcriptional repressor HrcA [Methyloligellaceae bacterium]